MREQKEIIKCDNCGKEIAYAEISFAGAGWDEAINNVITAIVVYKAANDKTSRKYYIDKQLDFCTASCCTDFFNKLSSAPCEGIEIMGLRKHS